jgi:hypothetical protein
VPKRLRLGPLRMNTVFMGDVSFTRGVIRYYFNSCLRIFYEG